jgi:hypothetical protein
MTRRHDKKQSRPRQHGIGRQAFVAWVLIAGFLLQPVLAYLVTPVLSHDAKGMTVVVCTLQGEKRVTLDLPSIVDQSIAPEPLGAEHCSALKLFQLSGTAQLPAPLLAPSRTLYAVTILDQAADRSHRSLHFSAYSTRAPPRLS